MAGESIRRVAAIGTGTIGASWAAVFLARGLTVSASDPAPGAETFLREFVAAAWPSLARLSPLPAELPWAALSFHTHPEAAVVGAEFIQESAPEREELKRTLLARLDAVLDPEIVIASSSSGLFDVLPLSKVGGHRCRSCSSQLCRVRPAPERPR